MKKKLLTPVPASRPKAKRRRGRALTFYLDKDLAEKMRLLGGGYMSVGIRVVLDTFAKDIDKAVAKARGDANE